MSMVMIAFLGSCLVPLLFLPLLVLAGIMVVFVQRLVFLTEPDVAGIDAEFIALRNLPAGYVDGLPEFPGSLSFLQS